jgi:hypothetical protein
MLFRTDTWQERKEAVVEVLEFRFDMAWLVTNYCGARCCGVAGLLLRTVSKDFVYLSGRVDSNPARNFSGGVGNSPEADFSWVSVWCEGDSALIERWPMTKRIYYARFSGARVEYGGETTWRPHWGAVTGNCDIIVRERIKELQ